MQVVVHQPALGSENENGDGYGDDFEPVSPDLFKVNG